jgi:hypothetical protein
MMRSILRLQRLGLCHDYTDCCSGNCGPAHPERCTPGYSGTALRLTSNGENDMAETL